ncbi:ER membrane protein complex subunit 3-like isoform X4 [Rhineura floridana]|uniref:ER membrane protein complex subunit 3-like isoform X4 n=1 Tax=Rhineura floridana TaxID=261503 RepID=UPI002AC8232E|nr:ER membrane protein complex subunit 3-like isoform X4 [Rhineura floridana]
MAAPELRLDGSIRFWVLLPVAWIAIAIGILRLRVAGLFRGERVLGWPEQRQDTQILARSRLLRENGRFLTHQGFLMRKHHFNNPESGFFRKTKRKVQPRNPLTAKVPFPLTLRFKPMLQRGINLPSLDPSWVSAASWYFLNVFGLRRMNNLILEEETAAEQNHLLLRDQFLGPAVPAPPDPNKAFKAEWEALELVSHCWALQDVEEQLMSQDLKLTGMFGPS